MITIEHRHGFSREEAAARIRALLDYWNRKEPIDIRWEADDRATFSGRVKGFKFSGEMRIDDARVRADVKAGFMAEKMGRSYVDRKIQQYLDPGTSLEELQARARG